jgi:hypothetical protein
MRLLRARLATTIRASIDTYLGLLDGLSREDSDDDADDEKVSYLTPPPRTAETGEA